ncbi:endolytic transglycosylase MltG [Candidatus Sulfurimonas marisnigri]|uniref:Endolytic murein transglycosylase n=1 Tax=Candidatus Sulfurimonas marisnigri TaxID=2740405 RepID=A0A7S7LY39_9BACT|nr:endolytic transglycosylase MltG [Candidatus Sulfurimonas marisnigri]QOY53618.1 endolytic transglycosylase MltG [Candidatus Sulfurimonas marisnigri]
MKWIFEIVLIIILSFMYYLNKPINSPKVIYIPQGSINKIITHLSDKNYNVSKLDSLLLRVIGSPQSGWIDIGTIRSRRADFLYKLTTAKAALQEITLIPGETTYVFLDQLSKDLKLDREVLQKEYDSQASHVEGALVPNTYKMPIGITEKMIIKILLSTSLDQMKSLSVKIFGSYNEKKWFHFVTVASIIQKESANTKEMPLVSSVIYNRLNKKMKLQMDGTLNYGKYSHVKVTPSRIKGDTSLYNTYRNKGLPSIPVCNVSFDAIRAAIFPAQTKYLYFMKSNSGTHDFSCNYSTHLSNIKRVTK